MPNLANTPTISTNLNVDPYYDDFTESSDYYRILFRPGLAVQARELTQLQSATQAQIARFGEHIVSDGSRVRGCENYTRRNCNRGTGTSCRALSRLDCISRVYGSGADSSNDLVVRKILLSIRVGS